MASANNTEGVHPGWGALLCWLVSHGMKMDELKVVARSSPGSGFGMFASEDLPPSTPLFSIPEEALLNSLTLAPHYPATKPRLSCTQLVSLHLLLHRPTQSIDQSGDPLFGPFISILPGDFDWHPLTWLWKESRAERSSEVESQLLDSLPPSILAKLNKVFGLFQSDWSRIQSFLQEYPSVQNKSPTDDVEESFLWGWLNVNTRCVYHRLAKTRAHPDNMTLCPILDFANHTPKEPFVFPEATQAELWDVGPSRKFGDRFILRSPSGVAVSSGEQLFLRYGMHANSTLFVEYGFVNHLDWRDEEISAESELDQLVKRLFKERGSVGSWMKEVLLDEGYWGEWSMQTVPAPAHPSYRLISALRLYHIIPANTRTLPPQHTTDQLLKEWRDTTLGRQDVISSANEDHWRGTLLEICEESVTLAQTGQSRLQKIGENDMVPGWLGVTKTAIKMLWQEESYVAQAVMKSLKDNVEF